MVRVPLIGISLPSHYVSIAMIWLVAFEFGLVILAIRSYDLVSSAFLRLCVLAFAGFLIHAHLPKRLRLAFFVALSAVGIVYVMGVANSAWLFAIGSILIAACHLPVPFRWRIGAVLAIAGVLMAVRGYLPNTVVGGAVLPILGSMFMFRLIIYLFDLQHEKPGVSPTWRIAYFFMLPNVCFPLFPLVDYKQFKATYYTEPAERIYQRGVVWMFRGVYHLLIYRLVYLYLTLDPAFVEGKAQFIQYSISSFLLYLRVSGTFHLAIGLLLMFGFNLPETHRQYYLASSFTDFWRRINIYWKDFMRRIVFNTVNFYLRRFGSRISVIVSTAIVFLATWVLHSYQWFWLRGEWLLATHDALFWGLLGSIFIINFLVEERFGAAPTLGDNVKWTPRTFAALVFRTVATFLLMTILWGLWSSDSMVQWLAMLDSTGNLWLVIALTVTALYTGSLLLRRSSADAKPRRLAAAPVLQPSVFRSVVPTTVGLFALLAVGHISVYSHFNDQTASVVDSIKTAQLNVRDSKKLEQGYYEQLLSVNITSELWDVFARGRKERLHESAAWHSTGDVLMGELIPNSKIIFKDEQLSVNRWGMRDRDYTESKPPGTLRIAILGASHVMGSGVADSETFEEIVENRLNEEHSVGQQRIEILNFAVSGYSALQSLYQLETRVSRFSPDYVLLIGHPQDEEMLSLRIGQIVGDGNSVYYPDIKDRLDELGITQNTPRSVIERRLRPVLGDLKSSIYQRIAEFSVSIGARPMFVLMPMVTESVSVEYAARVKSDMEILGFQAFDLAGVYDSYPPESLTVADWDNHPNAAGHALVAERLFNEIKRIGIF